MSQLGFRIKVDLIQEHHNLHQKSAEYIPLKAMKITYFCDNGIATTY